MDQSPPLPSKDDDGPLLDCEAVAARLLAKSETASMHTERAALAQAAAVFAVADAFRAIASALFALADAHEGGGIEQCPDQSGLN